MGENKEDSLKKVKEIIDLMKKNDLVEVELVDGDNKIMLKRPQSTSPVVTQIPIASAPIVPAQAPTPSEAPVQEVPEDEGFVEIKSPIVGTFYSSPSPDSKPYLAVGDTVEPETVVCIVEAMKVMNEIKAEVSGTIVKIFCKTGEAVEFGQALFQVKPD